MVKGRPDHTHLRVCGRKDRGATMWFEIRSESVRSDAVTSISNSSKLVTEQTLTYVFDGVTQTVVQGYIHVFERRYDDYGGYEDITHNWIDLQPAEIFSFTVSVTDGDSHDFLFLGGNLTQPPIPGVSFDGYGTRSMTLYFNKALFSPSLVAELLGSVTYYNDSDAPPDNRALNVSIMEDDGSEWTDSVALTFNEVNDAPTLSATALSPTFIENQSAVDLFDNVSVSTIEAGQSIRQLTFTVSGLVDGSSEQLVIDGTTVTLTDGLPGTTTGPLAVGYSVTVVNGIATVTLDSQGLTPTQAQSLIAGLQYANTSEHPGDTERVVTLTSIKDSGGTQEGGVDTTALSIASTVEVTPVNDAPSGTDKTITIDEDGSYTFSPEDFGYSDPEGDLFDVMKSTKPLSGVLTYGRPGYENAVTTDFQVSSNVIRLLVWRPDANANGDGLAFMNFQVRDDDFATDPTPNTITFNVRPVNDAPVFTRGADITVFEDSGPQTVTGWATAISAGAANEGGQVLTFTVTNDNNPLFAEQPTIAADGTLTYRLADNANGMATVTVVLSDDGGTDRGGKDRSDPITFTITADPVNDAPTLSATASSPTYIENQSAVDLFDNVGIGTIEAGQTIRQLTLTVSGLVDGSSEKLILDGTTVALTDGLSGTTNGSLSVGYAIAVFNGIATVTLDSQGLTPAEAQSLIDGLQYANTSENPGATDRVVTLTSIKDSGGTEQGGVDTTALSIASTVEVTPVNDAPVFTRGADITVFEDSGPQTVTGWATAISAGASNESGQTLTFTVTNDNNPLFAEQPTIAADGTLTYRLAANANGVATVTVVLSDDGGTDHGGKDRADPITFTITADPVNDAPTLSATALSPTYIENQSAVDLFDNVDIGTVEAGQLIQQLTFTVSGLEYGWGEMMIIDGTLLSLGPSGTVTTAGTLKVDYAIAFLDGLATVTLTDSQGLTAAEAQSLIDGLQYSLVGDDFVPTDRVFTLTGIMDNGGVGAGGADTTPLSISSTVHLLPVNDAPFFLTDGLATRFTENDAPRSLFTNTRATAMERGQAIQQITFTVSGLQDGSSEQLIIDGTTVTLTEGLPGTTTGPLKVGYSVTIVNGIATVALTDSQGLTDGEARSLVNGIRYTNTSEDPGTAQRVITVTSIQDNGGTENGGTDTSAVNYTSTISMISVNDAPTLSATALSPTFTENESAVDLFGNVGISTVEAGQTVRQLTLTVSGLVDGSSEQLILDGTTVALTDGLSGTTNGSLSVGYAIAVVNGVATVTLTHSQGLTPAEAQSLIDGLQYANTSENPGATDRVVTLTSIKDSGGTEQGGVDTTALSIASTVEVTPVNDAPVFTRGADITVLEDSGPQTVTGWATAISNESGQVLTFTVTNDNNPLFAEQPTITADGTLTYRLAANANGMATVTVVLSDDGGTDRGGKDRSDPITFTITADPVNDAPTDIVFTPVTSGNGKNLVVAENAAGAVIATVDTLDVDDNAFTYAVDDTRFEIVNGQLKLKAGVALDHEAAAAIALTVTATDSRQISVTRDVTVTVSDVNETPPNTAPFITTPNADTTLQSGIAFSLLIGDGHFSDAEGTDLDYLILVDGVAKPDWLTFDAETGLLTGTPTAAEAGTYLITVTATDGSQVSPSDEFTLIVPNPVNPPDTIGTRRNDILVGDDSDNLIDGRRGNDKLTGNGGADTFVFGKNHGRDVIIDFNPEEGDIIDLKGAIGIRSFQDLMKNHLFDIGDDIKIRADDGAVLIVRDIEPGELTRDMFIF
jgi:hypothetical protein